MTPNRREFLTRLGMGMGASALALTSNGLVAPLLGVSSDARAQQEGDVQMIEGVVFHDVHGRGVRQGGEPGVAGVLVSNGLDVVRTDPQGRYSLPVRPDMNLMIVQPSGWRVPLDPRGVPQFSYIHKPGGSTEALRFGGLPDTGPLPRAVDFPLHPAPDSGEAFQCAVLGDTQTYSGHEIEQFRNSAISDLVQQGLGPNGVMLYVGDVVGDDLGLLDRVLEVGSVVGAPQWLVLGNHDIDLDATIPSNATDSWRRIWGPNYYAFEVGAVTFVALDNIRFPCGADDAALPGRESCISGGPGYNIRVDDTQMMWLANLLAHIPEDRLIVLAHHGPMVSFVDEGSGIHQTDNATEIHQLLEGRPALSLSGHTHTTENHAPGQYFAGWQDRVGVGPLPFRHIVAGAVCGNWWQGDYSVDGTSQSLQRLGSPKGVLMLDFEGVAYRETYKGSGLGPDRGQWVDVNSPSFRRWFDELDTWRRTPAQDRPPVPPVTVNDLPDTRVLTPEDLAEGAWVTANVWLGSAETQVTLRIDGGAPVDMVRTQEGAGESIRSGADYADPFALKRQATVGRFAWESRSGEARNQGYEGFRGRSFSGRPQPQTNVADRNMHLWTHALPTDLPLGMHTLAVTSTDRHGRVLEDRLVIEVRGTRPAKRWRDDVWGAG
jgi:hypothetical protein